MAFPLVPFLAGAVLGGLGAYFYQDRKVRKVVSKAAKELPGKMKRSAADVSDKMSETYKDLRQRVSGGDEKPASARKRPARKTTKAKTTGRKTAARKKTTTRKSGGGSAQPATG